jgi:histidine triad (HIT) family protein
MSSPEAPSDPNTASSPGAGAQPPGGDTIFARILRGEIPCQQVFADDLCLAFRDVNPQAPVHVLVIPREPISHLGEAGPEHRDLLGHLLLVAAQVARQEGLSSWRTVINSGAEAGQTVFHLHVHVIGGRPLDWPPG